jgi:hypothetical protein
MEVHVTCDKDFRKKGKLPKGVINWVARPAPGKEPSVAEGRLYAEAVCLPRPLSVPVVAQAMHACDSIIEGAEKLLVDGMHMSPVLHREWFVVLSSR